MCTSPILIKSNKFLGSSREVPCGTCDECLRKRANDVYVRMALEYEYCREQGGNGFMCCLTYSDDLLPIFDFQGKKYKVFDKRAVILFIKRLRVNLDRAYLKNFGRPAPDFKYLVTSEYGSKTQRPHYHITTASREPISPSIFKKAFRESTYCRRFSNNQEVVERYFGIIAQCDEIDPNRGGIFYCAKYVLKDLQYTHADKEIREMINFQKEKVNAQFGIVHPDNEVDELRNTCIRSTKAYKKAIEEHVRPYRHMLQFYMISNDLGASAAVEKYGKEIVNTPVITIKGFTFNMPRQIKERVERVFGYKTRKTLDKNIMLNYLKNILEEHALQGVITRPQKEDLYLFAKTYIVPQGGNLEIMTPSDFDVLDDTLSPVKRFEDLCNEFRFYEDNDFLVMRDHIQSLINIYNSPKNLEFRAKIARKKREEEERANRRKKANKGY